ncbi:MAG: DUF2147 domain-containing protein [Treponema sp.]|nr:DUF2147 domain-containing protein [Treponema sp.]
MQRCACRVKTAITKGNNHTAGCRCYHADTGGQPSQSNRSVQDSCWKIGKSIIQIAIVFLIAWSVFAEEAIEGYWIATNQVTGKYLCGWLLFIEDGVLYGRIVSAYGVTPETISVNCKTTYPDYPSDEPVNRLPIIGSIFMYGLTQTENGSWSGGYIIDPDSGNIYRCAITYHAANGRRYKKATLEMHGTLLTVPLGVSQYWPAGTQEEAEGIR